MPDSCIQNCQIHLWWVWGTRRKYWGTADLDLSDESEDRSKVAKDVCAFTGKNNSPTDCHKV